MAAAYNLTSAGQSDGFFLKLNSNGTFSDAKRFGGLGNDYVSDITLGNTGELYLTGGFNGQVYFKTGVDSIVATSTGGYDAFMLKLNNLDSVVWAVTTGTSAGNDGAGDISLDNSNNIYTNYFFSDTVDCDPGPNVYKVAAGNYLVKYSQPVLPPSFYYRSRQSGNWNNLNSWETSPVEDFSTGVVGPAANLPNASNTFSVIVRSGHSITVTSNSTSHYVQIRTGGNLTINTGFNLNIIK